MSFDNALLSLENKLGRMSDWLLPYAIKDIRQMIRSKIFVGFFFLGFFIAAIVAFWAGMVDPKYISNIGPTIFFIFNIILDVGVLLILPVLTTMAMNQERSDNSFELQQISSSTPFKIVMGKWQSGVVQGLFFFFMILPFISFSYILKGITITQIIAYCFASLLFSQFLVCLSVFASAASDLKKIRQGIGFVLVLAAIAGGISLISLKGSLLFSSAWPQVEDAFKQWEFWGWLSATLILFLLLEGLFFSVSVGKLSAYTANKSFWPKIFFILIMVALSTMMFFILNSLFKSGISRYFDPTGNFLLVLLSVFFVLASFFFLEGDSLSKRQYNQLQKAPKLMVFVLNLFLPGRSSAICLFILMLNLLAFLLYYFVFSGQKSSSGMFFASAYACTMAYLAVFYFVGFFLQKFLQKESPRLVYGASVFVILFFFVAGPFFVVSFYMPGSNWLYSLNIFYLFDIASSGRYRENGIEDLSLFLGLGIGLGLSVFLWVFARIHMKRQVAVKRNYEAGERGE